MARAPIAVVLSPWSIEGSRLKGGAERTGAATARALRDLGFDVISLSSRTLSDRTAQRSFCEQIIMEDQHLIEAMKKTNLLVCLDRYPGDFTHMCPSFLQLSNLAYANECSAANPEWWNAAWVPSTHLRDLLVHSFGWIPECIRVIPPVVEFSQLDSEPDSGLTAVLYDAIGNTPRSRVLLFPHRSDKGKGLSDVLLLLKRLLVRDRRWLLLVSGSSSEETDEHESLVRKAIDTGLGNNVRLLPWWPATSMASLYRAAGCTIMASELDEGFGLVPYESVLAGTSVVARSSGALTYTEATRYGFHLVKTIASQTCIELIEATAGTTVPVRFQHAVARSFNSDRYTRHVSDALRCLFKGQDRWKRLR